MAQRIVTVLVALSLLLVLPACGKTKDAGSTRDGDTPPAVDEGASGSRLASGLYDQADGSVLAIGTLEYVDLEGGFWAITGAVQTAESTSDIVAVIQNSAELGESDLKALEGKTVEATGTRFDGASIRMAGPEIIVEAIREITDTAGAAE